MVPADPTGMETELARLAGPGGRVIAPDVQRKMLESLKGRLVKASLSNRVDLRLVGPDSLELESVTGRVDFVFAFAVVHELPSPDAFFRQAAQCLKPGGDLLLAEPSGHVAPDRFTGELASAGRVGLRVAGVPRIRLCHAALLRRS